MVMNINGIITPAITALDADGNIDYKANAAHIEHLVRSGVHGILSLGSIGEFFAFPLEERKKYASFVVEQVNGRIPVLIGTGHTDTEEAAMFTKFVGEQGADGAVVISPYYFALKDDSLYAYFAHIAGRSDTPVFLYNFPDRTGAELNAPLVEKLIREFPSIVGIKDTVDNISHTRTLLELKQEHPDFAVFSGFDEYFVPNLLGGGNGAIGGLSNVVPSLFTDVYDAFLRKDMDRLAELQKKVNLLMKLYTVSTPFIASLKYASSLAVPEIVPACSKPLPALTAMQKAKVETLLAQAGVKFERE